MCFFHVSSETPLQACKARGDDTKQKASLGRQTAGYSMLKITHPRSVGMLKWLIEWMLQKRRGGAKAARRGGAGAVTKGRRKT